MEPAVVRRVLIPIAIVVAALALIVVVCAPEIECNRAWAVVAQGNKDALNLSDYDALLLVRNNIPRAVPCVSRNCPNVFLMYELAETYRRLGRHEDAIALLQRSMQFDRRPEVYVALGDSFAQTGRVEEGVALLIQGARFYGTDLGQMNYALRNTAYRDIAYDRMGIH